MCVSIGYLIFIFPLVAIVGAFLGYKYGRRFVKSLDEEQPS